MLALRPKAVVLAGAAAIALSLFGPGKPAQACSSETYLGTLCLFGGNFAIRNFAMAQGQLLAISSYSALFSILGCTYGGDCRTTFALPDLRGRVPIGFGQGSGLSNYQLGQKGGSQTVTQTVAQIASHTHGATATAHGQSGAGGTDTPTDAVWAQLSRQDLYSTTAPNVEMLAGAVTATIAITGNNQPIDIRQPYLALNWLIATNGPFPPRN
jgi:microcystin-dependent protein